MAQVRARSPSRPEGRIALLGVPLGSGAPHPGCVFGPAALRAAGLKERLAAAGCKVADYGDVQVLPSLACGAGRPPNVNNYAALRAWTCAISTHAYELARSGAVPVFLGGDHSLSMGTINGVARYWREMDRPLFVLWIDAHADYNTPAITPTGNLHGMAAAFLCGEAGLDDLLAGGPRASIAPDRLTLFGLRSVDSLERLLVEARPITVTSMADIAAGGAMAALESLLARVDACGGVLHVSFDVDVLDPSLAPAVGTAEPGGIDLSTVLLILERLRVSGLVRAVDVVELNPPLDDEGRTVRLTVDLIAGLLGAAATDVLAADVLAAEGLLAVS
ncbi:arginase [Bradyrhizobium sp. WD16]|nr:arginase [Bradyrhizobium sp. WD16]